MNAVLSQVDYSAKTRVDTIELVKQLIRSNKHITSRSIGYNGEPSRQYYRFLLLLNSFNNPDHLKLTNDSSACLRFYANGCLLHNRCNNIKEIETLIKKDTTLIPVYFAERKGNYTAKEIIKRYNDWYN